jgi:hypothetical protein
LHNSRANSVSTWHKLLSLGSQPLLLSTCRGSLSLEFFDPLFERRAPINRVSLKRLGKEQQGCEFCSQRARTLVRLFGQVHPFAESCELTAQLLLVRHQQAWTLISRRRRVAGQRDLNRRSDAIYRES